MNGSSRPMTGTRAAGYSSAGVKKRITETPTVKSMSMFSYVNYSASNAAALLKAGRELTLPQRLVIGEKECNDLVLQCCELAQKGDIRAALDKAKDAFKKISLIERQITAGNISDQNAPNIGLSVLSVKVNLATLLQQNKEYDEAAKVYLGLLESDVELYRFRLNLAHIYYEQRKFSDAVKQCRIALDAIRPEDEVLRINLERAIAHSFFSLRVYPDAVEYYKKVLASPLGAHDRPSALNLMLCHYARGEKEQMKNLFEQMCRMTIFRDTDFPVQEGKKGTESALSSPARSTMLNGSPARKTFNLFEELEREQEEQENSHHTFAFPSEDPITGARLTDPLKIEFLERRRRFDRCLTLAGKLIAPVIERTPELGYDWVKETLVNADAPAHVITDARLAKAGHYLRKKDFESAVELFKTFQDQDSEHQVLAATNLSFLSFLEGNLEEADRFADMAVQVDRYNAHALVNKGICLYMHKQQYAKAKEHFLEAIGVEADCVEAIYNLGLVNKDRGLQDQDVDKLRESLQAFEKLHSILPGFADALYQLAQVNELLGYDDRAVEWYQKLLASDCRPTDGTVSAKLAALHERMGDTAQAVARYADAYRANPTNVDVAMWLGVHFVRSEECDAAIPFFRRAAEVQPEDPKWQLMVASCLRRNGDTEAALQQYEEIHARFPRDLECLKFLIMLCQDKGLACEEYKERLAVLQNMQDDEEQAAMRGNQYRDRYADQDVSMINAMGSRHNGASMGGQTYGSGFNALSAQGYQQQPSVHQQPRGYSEQPNFGQQGDDDFNQTQYTQHSGFAKTMPREEEDITALLPQ